MKHFIGKRKNIINKSSDGGANTSIEVQNAEPQQQSFGLCCFYTSSKILLINAN